MANTLTFVDNQQVLVDKLLNTVAKYCLFDFKLTKTALHIYSLDYRGQLQKNANDRVFTGFLNVCRQRQVETY
jgi:hypothetical protein